MDHLPQVVGHRASPPRVPCVCDPRSFDGMNFETFPLRKGFRVIPHDALVPPDEQWPQFILNADGSRLSSESLAEFVQLWLFFGLLVEVLKVSGVSVDIRDFEQHEGEETFVTTKALPRYFSEWEQKEALLSEKDRKVHFRRQQQMLMASNYFRLHQISGHWWEDQLLYWVEQSKERYVMDIPLPIEMSIIILSETLDRASRRAFGRPDQVDTDWSLSPSLINYLKICGWCPSEISLAQEGLDDTSGAFAGQLSRGRLEVNHSQCSVNKCRAFDFATEQYSTKHDTGCPGCQHVGIDGRELSSILRCKRAPRAVLQLATSDHTPSIELTLGDSGRYVAISHVWSDGLGNPSANSLPACQLLRLHRMVAGLGIEFVDRKLAIWIDSLLVPVEKGFEKRLALTQLCEYYQAAEKVLVLDSDLLQASQACTKQEQITRIFFSTWMRRLWTLEEGILSRENLVFQFRDGTVRFSDLGDLSHFSASAIATGSIMYGNLLASLPDLANYYRYPARDTRHRRPIIAEILPALEYRSTTKAVDEPLCLAHILKLDASKLVVIDDANHRMEKLLKMFSENGTTFPKRFLFTREPKLPIDGFRWAPASFMTLDLEDNAFLRDHKPTLYTSLCDKRLLIDSLAGFTLRFGSESFKHVTYAEVDKRIYAITPVPVGESCRSHGRFWTLDASNEALDVNPSRWNPEMQAMLGKSPNTTAVLQDVDYRILVSSYDVDGKPDDPDGSLLYVRYISQVGIRELKTVDQNHGVYGADSQVILFTNPDWNFAETEKQMREAFEVVHDPKTSTFLRCAAIDPCQRWCVG